ncbi:PREDICTED: thioredoxin domain-containing protein 17-like [Branchiostoma belcheri]|uniref:Thioredoxin domain-containing protein 17 n=1 Tax=Branchiostoma belcheri TaxID=7741 RepID=A0A6P4YW61_BRABE|nr:PREDICTED: thioredoxin domain-containing protein 17-like [Branchiostoma belcheri]
MIHFRVESQAHVLKRSLDPGKHGNIMVVSVKVEGLSAFLEAVENHKGKAIFALFTGSHDAQGKSWCPDCVAADPVVEQCVKGAPEDAVFITCSVGDRAFWKDQNNEFRTHPKLKLTSVPTLIRWETPQRLMEEDCAKSNLVSMLFEED